MRSRIFATSMSPLTMTACGARDVAAMSSIIIRVESATSVSYTGTFCSETILASGRLTI